MNEERGLYRKVMRGSRPTYVKVAETDPQGWFPTAGLWLVEETRGGKSSHVFVRQEKVAELPDPLPAAALERHRDTIAAALMDIRERCEWISVDAMAGEILEAVREKMQKEG